jgi:pimeloyl-ACP methyl ester carboxylesterase
MPPSPLRTLVRPDGARIGYFVDRPAQEPRHTLLLLHGLASNLTRWSEFVSTTRLSESCALIRVDLRGHERSDWSGRIGMDLWCNDLIALLQYEKVERVFCIGHSLGAQVGLNLAARHPETVAALALIDPVFRDALHRRKRWMVAARPLFLVAAAVVRTLNAVGVARRHIVPLDLRELDAAARRALASPQAQARFIAQYSSTRADLRHFRSAHYLQEVAEMFAPLPALELISQPTLVLLSTGATFAGVDPMRAQAQRLPNARIELIACHHWPLTERPAEVRAKIESWVSAL